MLLVNLSYFTVFILISCFWRSIIVKSRRLILSKPKLRSRSTVKPRSPFWRWGLHIWFHVWRIPERLVSFISIPSYLHRYYATLRIRSKPNHGFINLKERQIIWFNFGFSRRTVQVAVIIITFILLNNFLMLKLLPNVSVHLLHKVIVIIFI